MHVSYESARQDICDTLGLPASAVVIDVREQNEPEDLLLEGLVCMIDNLAQHLHAQEVARWRHLGPCMAFVRLDALVSPRENFERATFELTEIHPKKTTQVQGREQLALELGRYYVDRVREGRASALQDYSLDSIADPDPELPTVRVFFLVDLGNNASLRRASIYAQWLKGWCLKQYGRGLRQLDSGSLGSGQEKQDAEAHKPSQQESLDEKDDSQESHYRQLDNLVNVVAVGINAPVGVYRQILLPILEEYQNSIDIMIILQEYNDKANYLEPDQLQLTVELTLYTLILYWPDIFEDAMKEPRGPQIDVRSGMTLTPCPTYTIGIAALEHSIRLAKNWFAYGLIDRYLTRLTDESASSRETKEAEVWLDSWWQQVQKVVPDQMTDVIDEFSIFTQMARTLNKGRKHIYDVARTQENFRVIREQLSKGYSNSSDATLERVWKSTSTLLARFHIYTQHDQSTLELQEQTFNNVQSGYAQLDRLYLRACSFPRENMLKVHGALPHLQKQLQQLASATKKHMQEARKPDFQHMCDEFAGQVRRVEATQAMTVQTWRLPMIGSFLPSTVSIWTLAVILCCSIAWLPTTLLNWQDSTYLLWTLKVITVLFILGSAGTFLFTRYQRLQEEFKHQYKQLHSTVQNHIQTVRKSIAAQVACALLEWADLYAPDQLVSPYENKLQVSKRLLERVQHQAHCQHQLAEWIALTTMQDPISRYDTLNWQAIEQQFYQELADADTKTHPFHALTGMFLQYLSQPGLQILLDEAKANRQTALLEADISSFSTALTMITAVMLAIEVKSPDIPLVQPLLQQLIDGQHAMLQKQLTTMQQLQQTFSQITQVPALPALFMQAEPATVLSLQTLLDWVTHYYTNNMDWERGLSQETLSEFLLKHRISLEQLTRQLAHRATLLGQPDVIAGNDNFYLLISPENIKDTLKWQSRSSLDGVQLRFFPDKERAIYLRVHRIRYIIE